MKTIFRRFIADKKGSNNADYTKRLDSSLFEAVRIAAKTSIGNPAVAWESAKMLWYKERTARIRKRWNKRGLTVPPYTILNVTYKCNLDCKGCFDKALNHKKGSESSDTACVRIISEASITGVAVFIIIGGEPLCRKNLLRITVQFPDCLFLVFTNITLLDEEKIRILKKHKNVIPVLGMEGYSNDADERRGNGTFEKIYPFSPFSDSNLRTCSLEQALDSPLFKSIRAYRDKLDETKGNCALWVERSAG
jgi:sulfatase maturation enzyme AslB (radical SAM superfamily)